MSCSRLCCMIFCCQCKKKAPLESLDATTRLMPKAKDDRLFSKNELHIYGLIPENAQETYIFPDQDDIVRKICVGNNHAIALLERGRIAVLGDNTNGQLGKPFKKGDENKYKEWEVYLPKVDSLGNVEVIDIACGDNFSLLLVVEKEKRYLVRLGYKQEDRYKDDIENINPISLVKLDYQNIEIQKIFAFGQRSLFYTLNSEIYVGEIDFKMNPISKYKHFHTLPRRISSIAMGSEHCLILDVDKNLYAIGDNTYGEIGLEDSMNLDKIKEIKYFDKTKNSIWKIAVGARHSLVLLKDGSLYAFGDNSDGQCTGFSTRYTTPNKIIFEQKERIIDIFCGYNHNMILLENGDIYAWGDNTSGKLSLRDIAQSVNNPKILQILKGKSVNSVGLGFNLSIFSTSKSQNSIAFKTKESEI